MPFRREPIAAADIARMLEVRVCLCLIRGNSDGKVGPSDQSINRPRPASSCRPTRATTRNQWTRN